jgi:hypothetical protein
MSRYRTVRQRRKAREDLIGYIILVPTGLIILGFALFGFIQIFAVWEGREKWQRRFTQSTGP